MLPIFYINLASRTDRREHVEKQLEALGLSGTRIDAVTPADLAGVDYGQLSASELGCSRSHQRIWQLLVDQDIPAALILEDDVLLSQHVATVLADPRLLDGVDAIQFETRGTSALVGRPVPTPVEGVSRNRLMSSSLGSAAYIMTRHLAARLLAHPERDNLPLDTFIFGRPGSVFYEARIFQAVPALAIQLDQIAGGRDGAGRSDLNERRGIFSLRDPRSSESRLKRGLRHWGHHLRVVTTFGPAGELWGARQHRLPVADDLRRLM